MMSTLIIKTVIGRTTSFPIARFFAFLVTGGNMHNSNSKLRPVFIHINQNSLKCSSGLLVFRQNDVYFAEFTVSYDFPAPGRRVCGYHDVFAICIFRLLVLHDDNIYQSFKHHHHSINSNESIILLAAIS
jgi:hypothetical protein